MGLFSRHSSEPDRLRDRDYVLSGCPLVAQDDQVALVDATVRLAVRRATSDNDLVLGYDPGEEVAVHAVCVAVLRLMAEGVPHAELLVGRARVTEAIEHGLAFAPVGAGVDVRVMNAEVRPYAPELATFRHEFRVVSS